MQGGPDTSQGVLYHVANYPVWGEKLGGSSLLVTFQSTLLTFLGFGIRLALGDIKLVKPAHNLYVLAIFVGHPLADIRHETLLRKQVGREQQFGIIAD